jgi:hypothetical protein
VPPAAGLFFDAAVLGLDMAALARVGRLAGEKWSIWRLGEKRGVGRWL